jgi:predicted negative regulator of RcsB-dependent stress response
LKRDVFALEVGHTFEYVERHRRQVVIGVCVGLALVLSVFGYRWYSKRQHALRQTQLHAAMRILDAIVGPENPRAGLISFPTQKARAQAVYKAFGDIARQYRGTDEADVARYFWGTAAADQGKLDEAEKAFLEAAGSRNRDYGSLAKLALAQVYHARGKTADAEKLLRELMDKPTAFVSKEQATIELARIIAETRPAEARKLLEPLRTMPGAVSRAALNAFSALPPQ